MTTAHGIGVLATIEDGTPRLRPMEFSRVHGELWAATSRQSHQYRDTADGQHVEILFLDEEYDQARVRGVLEWSTDAEDCRHLWQVREDMAHWFTGCDDPNLVILKVIPEQADYKSTRTDEIYRRKAA